MQFDPDRRAAYGTGDQLPLAHRAPGRQGLVVLDVVLDARTWPCRLWRVTDLEDPVRLTPNLWYLRCAAFRIEEKLPAWQVFGPRGVEVAGLVARADRLTPADVAALVGLPGDDEKAA